MGIKALIHQPSYSLLNRWIEEDLLAALDETGMGCIAFSALAQGLLTDKYLQRHTQRRTHQPPRRWLLHRRPLERSKPAARAGPQ